MARQQKYVAGYKTGELTVLSRVGDSVLCACSCGRTPTILLSNMSRTKACGHLKGSSHGKTDTSLRGIWEGIQTRCNNRRHPSYLTHGLRGIKCNFSCFEEFQFAVKQDLGPRPDPEYTIDRINPLGHYERYNLRWANKEMQRMNQQPRRTRTQIDFDTRLNLAERDAWDYVALSKAKFGNHEDYLVAI